MRDDVDEFVIVVRPILRNPVADVRHTVLLENFGCVIAESSVESVELSFVAGVCAQLEYASGSGLRGVRFHDPIAYHGSGGEQACGQQLFSRHEY
jgi:hypothetical protein